MSTASSKPASDSPIACTLDASSGQARMRRWQQLSDSAKLGAEHDGNVLEVRYRSAPGAFTELRELVVLEQECCPFVDWRVTQERSRTPLGHRASLATRERRSDCRVVRRLTAVSVWRGGSPVVAWPELGKSNCFSFRSGAISIAGMPLETKRPRIVPLEPPFAPSSAAALELLGPPIALFRVLALRPALAEAMAPWGGYWLSGQSVLSPRLREIAIGRTAALCRADYEWAVHIAYFADKVGLTEEQLQSLRGPGASDPCWVDQAEKHALAMIDELHSTHDVCDQTWAQLVGETDEQTALELVLLCGWYHAISFAVKALRLPLEHDQRMGAA